MKDYIQPFATATESEIMNGVNYASGSSGIRDEAGSNLVINIFFLIGEGLCILTDDRMMYIYYLGRVVMLASISN